VPRQWEAVARAQCSQRKLYKNKWQLRCPDCFVDVSEKEGRGTKRAKQTFLRDSFVRNRGYGSSCAPHPLEQARHCPHLSKPPLRQPSTLPAYHSSPPARPAQVSLCPSSLTRVLEWSEQFLSLPEVELRWLSRREMREGGKRGKATGEASECWAVAKVPPERPITP
jgi:hypothetical protein